MSRGVRPLDARQQFSLIASIEVPSGELNINESVYI